MTLEEVFTERKLDIHHLRIFGCVAYCRIPAEKRTKLDPTTKKRVLVGNSEASKSYRIYIPTTMKTVLHKDVKFEEERALQIHTKTRTSQKLKPPVKRRRSH